MLKLRLASTESERQSTLRRIEQKVRETYSGMNLIVLII